MTKDINAIYENGTFRLVGETALPLPEGARVRLSIEQLEASDAADVLSLAADVYSGLSDDDIAEVEAIAAEA